MSTIRISERVSLPWPPPGDGIWDWLMQTRQNLMSARLTARCWVFSQENWVIMSKPVSINPVAPGRQDRFSKPCPDKVAGRGNYEIETDEVQGWQMDDSRLRQVVVERDLTAHRCASVGTHIDLTQRKTMEWRYARQKKRPRPRQSQPAFLANMSHEIRTLDNAIPAGGAAATAQQ